MPGYVVLNKYTSKGLGTIKESPDRIKRIRQMAEQSGIRLVGIWVTLGEYDLVSIWDAPDDSAVAAFALTVASQGNVTTQTMRALSEEEFAQVVGKLP